MVRRVEIMVIDDPKDDKNVKFLKALLKLTGKEVMRFTKEQILGKNVEENEEMQEILSEVLERYKKIVPENMKFIEGKINKDGTVKIWWSYENKSKN
jgi:hypothetical protein